jgi:hypothetical protein
MENHDSKTGENRKRTIYYTDGRFYFTKEAERTFYFVLTLLMLVAGMLYKAGIF